MKDKLKHKVGNRELYDAMMEKRRSGATMPHVPKPRKGSRNAKNQKAIKESKEN